MVVTIGLRMNFRRLTQASPYTLKFFGKIQKPDDCKLKKFCQCLIAHSSVSLFLTFILSLASSILFFSFIAHRKLFAIVILTYFHPLRRMFRESHRMQRINCIIIVIKQIAQNRRQEEMKKRRQKRKLYCHLMSIQQSE